MAEQDLDKSHQASPYKLARARERGQVPRSAELVSAAVLLVGALAVYAKADDLLRHVFFLSARLYGSAARYANSPAPLDAGWQIVKGTLVQSATWLAPFFGALILVAIIANVAQVGVPASFHPLKPDWNRLNPAAGFKRLFSMPSLYQALMSLVKLVVICAVCYWSIAAELPRFVASASSPAGSYMKLMLQSMGAISLKVAAALALLALVDLWYTRMSFGRRMRMSTRELKEEHKHREGDPRIRRRLRELRMEAYKRSMSSRGLPKSDVLIVNPTRIAVALQYEHGAMASPRVVAKGVGGMARKMREYASRKGVPIVENRKLARALLRRVDIEASIPEDLFADVARIIVWVLSMRRRGARA